MKKILSIVLTALFIFSSFGLSSALATDYKSLYLEFIKGDFKRFLTSHEMKYYIDKLNNPLQDAYMIDIDNDSDPELITVFADGDAFGMFFEYQNGSINRIPDMRFETLGGGTAGSVWDTIYQDSDGKIYIEHYLSQRQSMPPNNAWYVLEELVMIEKGKKKIIFSSECDEEKNKYYINGKTVTKANYNAANKQYNDDLEKKYIKLISSRDYGDTFFSNIKPSYGRQIDRFWVEFSPIWPAETAYQISSLYYYSTGAKHSSKYSTAIDILPSGNVLAIETGEVITAGWDSKSGLGNYIEIKHSNGKISLYAHLKKIDVSRGAKVNKGQKIGIIGNTSGKYTLKDHLHFELSSADPWKDYYREQYKDKLTYQTGVYNNYQKEVKAWLDNNYKLQNSLYVFSGKTDEKSLISTQDIQAAKIEYSLTDAQTSALNMINSYYDSLGVKGKIAPYIFMFEGVGSNRMGTTGRFDAMCVVVDKVNDKYSVTYINKDCTTIPDRPTDPTSNADTNVPTLIDGIYDVVNHIHKPGSVPNGYPSLSLNGKPNVMRWYSKSKQEKSTSTAILIHRRYQNDLISKGVGNSAGCLLVGYNDGNKKNSSTGYNDFARIVGFAVDGKTENGDKSLPKKATVIINRSLAKDKLLSIYDNSERAVNIILDIE